MLILHFKWFKLLSWYNRKQKLELGFQLQLLVPSFGGSILCIVKAAKFNTENEEGLLNVETSNKYACPLIHSPNPGSSHHKVTSWHL